MSSPDEYIKGILLCVCVGWLFGGIHTLVFRGGQFMLMRAAVFAATYGIVQLVLQFAVDLFMIMIKP